MATSHTSVGTIATGATTAETIKAALESSMEDNTGVVEVEVDGQRVRYDRAVGMKERATLGREIARAAGKKPPMSQFNLGAAW